MMIDMTVLEYQEIRQKLARYEWIRQHITGEMMEDLTGRFVMSDEEVDTAIDEKLDSNFLLECQETL